LTAAPLSPGNCSNLRPTGSLEIRSSTTRVPPPSPRVLPPSLTCPVGTAAPGRQVIGIAVSHLQLAASPPVTRTQVQVSFNNGKTWQNAAVHRSGPARFRATFTAPPSHDVSLRVVAPDATGNSIAETIRAGYQTSA
jgi:hypothetical protein